MTGVLHTARINAIEVIVSSDITFPKFFRRPDKRIRAFPEDYRRLPKTTEEDPNMFRSYTNKFKCS